MLGFSAEELSRKSIASLTLIDDRESTLVGHARLWRGDIAHLDVEKRYVRKDGSALWVRVTTSLVRGGGAEPVCSVEFLRDISARKEMAAALLAKPDSTRHRVAELPLALLACDVTDGLRTTTARRSSSLEFPRRTRPPSPATPTPSHPRFIGGWHHAGTARGPSLARALRGDDVSDVELVIVPPTGAVRASLSSARRLLGPAGQALGAVAVVQDITERPPR